MMKLINSSEVAHFREQQARQEEATHLGLHGTAITARHDFIEARMGRQGTRLLRLLNEGRHDEVERLLDLPDWGTEEETKEACRTLTE